METGKMTSFSASRSKQGIKLCVLPEKSYSRRLCKVSQCGGSARWEWSQTVPRQGCYICYDHMPCKHDQFTNHLSTQYCTLKAGVGRAFLFHKAQHVHKIESCVTRKSPQACLMQCASSHTRPTLLSAHPELPIVPGANQSQRRVPCRSAC
jgi:hypothetical protein